MTMPSARRKTPEPMTSPISSLGRGTAAARKFQLVDGELRAMSPGSATHGAIQTDSGAMSSAATWSSRAKLPGRHRSPLIATRVRANVNLRVPGSRRQLHARLRRISRSLPDPIVLIEILSPGNASDTWDNVWSYTTIPSVREIVVVHSTRVFAELLRRDADGNWPAQPMRSGRMAPCGSRASASPVR